MTKIQTYLVTGAAGFIGSNLVHYLVKKGHSVIAYDKLTYAGNTASIDDISPDIFTLIEGDICNTKFVFETLRHYKIDSVFHLAAESHVDRSIDGPTAFIETNINGTFSMLYASRQYYESLCSKKRIISNFYTYRRTKYMAALGIGAILRKKLLMLRIRPTLHQKQHPTTSFEHGSIHMNSLF